MNHQDIERLEAKGFTVGNASDFLGLSPVEEALVETGLVLSNLVRETRLAQGVTQAELAERMGTKQPNIARLETAAGTSFDKQFQALYALGVSPREIGDAIAGVEQALESVRAIASHATTTYADDKTSQTLKRNGFVLETA